MDTNNHHHHHPPYTYPDSGNSSPHSVENRPPSFEDLPLSTPAKVKLMVSYNGKIQPRSHDNTLSYFGGDTKILSIDRNVKFSTIYSKLASLTSLDGHVPSSDVKSGGFSFKYRLPGEDLDSLISVTNDDDLENMLLEYDRLFLFSPNKPVRLRLFLFSRREQKQPSSSKGGGGGGSGFSSMSSDQLKVGEVGPDPVYKLPGSDPPLEGSVPVNNNVDYLFGLDKVSGPVKVPVNLLNKQETVSEPELLQELNRLKIAALEFQQQKSAVKPPENQQNLPDQNIPANNPANVQIPAANWQQIEHHPQLQLPPQQIQQFHQQQQQAVYVMHAPPQGNVYAPPQGNVYAPPLISGQTLTNQGYYQLQRMPSDVSYMMQQPVYNMPAMSVAAQVTPGMRAPVSYDSVTGMQVYYGAPPQGGVVTAGLNGDFQKVMPPTSSGV